MKGYVKFIMIILLIALAAKAILCFDRHSPERDYYGMTDSTLTIEQADTTKIF